MQDRDLWRRLREAALAPAESAAAEGGPDSLTLAAYLDGTLPEAERERVEAWLAEAPEGLELLLSAREALDEPDMPAPDSLVRRASALVPAPKARLAGGLGRWLAGAGLGLSLTWSGAVAAVLLACVVGFELGQIGYDSTVAVEQILAREASLGFDQLEEFL